MPPANATRRPDGELRAITALTRRLPHWKGAGVLGESLRRWYVRKPRAPVATRVLGLRMRLEPNEYVDGVLLVYPQFYEHRELAFLRRHLRPGDVFLDVGAHIGLYSLVAARAVGPQGRVIAVEADPYNCARLRDHLEQNGFAQARAVNVGVSDRVEELRLGVQLAGNRSGSSFLFPQDDGVLVPCEPLAAILEREGVTRLRGAKLDIEGYEYRVLARFLADAERSLLPDFVIVEYYPEWAAEAGGNVLDLLAAHGYRVRARHAANYVLVRRRSPE